MLRTALRVNVFGNPDSATGADAVCAIFDETPSRKMMQRLSTAFSTVLCCAAWRDDGLEVSCLQSGKFIQFCGHGLLAMAHAWRHCAIQALASTDALPMRCGRRSYICEMRDGTLWLRAHRLRCRITPLEPAIAAHFDPPPVAAAEAGGSDGYRIFEWPAGTDIATVQPEAGFLHCDRRATILTAECADPRYSFLLRYLAPQYGSIEDQATGSANVVLADYWQQRGLPPPFHALQRSAGGGVIDSDIDGRDVLLGGQAVVAPLGPHDEAILSATSQDNRPMAGKVE